jgi:ABC-type sugar transport system ATPase subunit
MASVNFEHVYKRFNKVEVVHDISLQVRDRSSWCWWVPQAVARRRACA